LYEALYRCIRQDILDGNLKPGEKLPSKRALAQHLELGKITVEAAYAQLLDQGYIRSREKVGFFVEAVERPAPASIPAAETKPAQTPPAPLLDLTANGTGHFPFTVWSRLQREVILDYDRQLLLPLPNQGIPELRSAIARHLSSFRGMAIDPENILIGAGTDFLYNLLIQLLGRDKTYAVEEPGYGKIRQIYAASGVNCISVPMDSRGVCPGALKNAQVLHISPSHHFPTGLVTPLSRRQELLSWAGQSNWIIEDDYDSEFRFASHPLPALQSMAPERVIYINSFSKSLAPSIRISYAVLPEALMEQFRSRLGFYGCTVPSFEQYTLARFLSGGHFEKHINRMRRFYQKRRNLVIDALTRCAAADKLTILEQDAGLHFLLQVDTQWSDARLTDWLMGLGIRIQPLSSFYHASDPGDLHCLVMNYSGLEEQQLSSALERLEQAMKGL
ncbi:MAG: PLP-dependent aminotransferase family protein, partial [Faecousia sp.]